MLNSIKVNNNDSKYSPSAFYKTGYSTSDSRWANFVQMVSFDVPASVREHEFILYYCGINAENNKLYFAIWDKTENVRAGYYIFNTVYSEIPSGIELFEITSNEWSGKEDISYNLGNFKILLNWDCYASGMWMNSENEGFPIYPEESKQFEYLINRSRSGTATNFFSGFVCRDETVQNIMVYFSADGFEDVEYRLNFIGVYPDGTNQGKFYFGLITPNSAYNDYFSTTEKYQTIPQTGYKVFKVSGGLNNRLSNITVVINWAGLQK